MKFNVVRKPPQPPPIDKVVIELNEEEAKALYLIILNIGGNGKIRDTLHSIGNGMDKIFDYSTPDIDNILDRDNYLVPTADRALNHVWTRG